MIKVKYEYEGERNDNVVSAVTLINTVAKNFNMISGCSEDGKDFEVCFTASNEDVLIALYNEFKMEDGKKLSEYITVESTNE